MSFTAIISANIKDFESNLQKAQGQMDGFSNSINNSLNQLGDSFLKAGKVASIFSGAMVAGAGAVAMFVKQAGDAASTILSATVALDTNASTLQEYELVGIAAGTTTDAFSRSVEALTRRLKDAGEDSDRTSQLIQALGVSLTDAEGGMRRTGDITDDLVVALANMENVSERNVIASQLFGRQWATMAPILAMGASEIEKVKGSAHDLGIVLSEDALKASDAFRIEFDKLQMQLKAVKNQLASELAPVLIDTLVPIIQDKVVPAIRQFAEWIGGLADRFNNLSPRTKEIIVAITGIAVAIGPALLALGGLLKILPLIGAAMTALTGPVGLIVAAVAAAAILIIKYWDEIKTFFINVANSVTQAIAKMASNIAGLLEKVGMDKMASKLRGFQQTMEDAFIVPKPKVDDLENSVDEFGNTVNGTNSNVNGLAGGLKGLGDQAEDTRTAFEKLVAGMTVSEAVQATTLAIEDLQSRIVKFQTGILPTSNLTKDLTDANKQLSELTAGLDLLTGGREINIDVKMNTDGISATGIDTASFIDKIEQLGRDAQASLSKGFEGMLVTTIDYGQMLSSGLTDVAGSIGDALGSGNFKDLGKGLIDAMGKLAQQFGSLLIGMGVAALNLQTTLITQPWLAIAAGAALVALGAAASAAASKMVNNATSGGGTSSYRNVNTGPQLGQSDYRGMYTDNWAGNVTFKIGNNELVGVLEQANKRNNRIG